MEEFCDEAQEENVREEGTFSPIIETKFERVLKNAHEKTEKVKYGLLKIKVKPQGVKTLAEENLETKLRGREELLSKVDKVTLPSEKSKEKENEKTF